MATPSIVPPELYRRHRNANHIMFIMFHQHAKCLCFRALAARGSARKGPHARNPIAPTTPTRPHPHHPSYCRRIRVPPTQNFFSSVSLQDVKDQDKHDSDHGSQTSKQDRRQIHEESSNRAANRKELNRRRILAEELMRFFATNDECFNTTLRELNINKTWGSDTGLSEYRSFYLDSLSSFGTMLAENGDAKCSGTSAANILDQFAGCGEFSDNPQLYSKTYRSMAAMMQREVEERLALEQLQKSLEQKLQELRVELLSLQSESLALNLMSEGTYSNELDMIEEELSRSLSQRVLVSESRKARKEINKRKNTLDKIRSDAAKLKRLISRIESEFEEIEWPMPKHDFQAVTEKLLKVAASVAPALAEFVTHRHEDFDKYRKLEMQTDLTRPHEWYPRARLDKRRIIFHAGPTNSGKTYNALQRLKQANKGMYLAPLRLLAAEIYENLNAEGIYIDLLTGQERREVPFATHRSSTVELACLDEDYDVVVIDEIQMLCDEFRGFAWTRALLGVRCKEVHVCGGAEAIEIVKKITNMCGDDFELHRYERFGNLNVLDESLAKSPTSKGSYANVQPGDCVVAFSRHDIFGIKKEIEETTQFKCCVIYGSLPPDVRAEQARRFNDPNSEYDILVASDAIGMGLNLSIKRIIFNTMFKNNGERIVQLDHSSVKQIAGRAGRRNSLFPHGEVTCRDPNDMSHLKKCMMTEIKPLEKAGLIPTPVHIALFNQLLKQYGTRDLELHETLRKFAEMATLQGDFFLCRKKSMEVVSLWLKDVTNLSTVEKFILCMSPVNESCPKSKNTFVRYVETYATGKVPGVHYSMRPKPAKSFNHLADLCSVHHQLELFLWLQGKLPSNAVEVLRAAAMKERTIELINSGLLEAEKLSLDHDYVSKDVRVKKAWASERKDLDD